MWKFVLLFTSFVIASVPALAADNSGGGDRGIPFHPWYSPIPRLARLSWNAQDPPILRLDPVDLKSWVNRPLPALRFAPETGGRGRVLEAVLDFVAIYDEYEGEVWQEERDQACGGRKRNTLGCIFYEIIGAIDP